MKNIFPKNTRGNKKNQAAFSMIELMVAIFILSLITLTSVTVFAKIVSARKYVRESSNDIEAGREAIQVMAKNIRMSSFLGTKNSGKLVYFYSEVSSTCISYRFSGNVLYSALHSPFGTGADKCSTDNINYGWLPITRSDMQADGIFIVTNTDTTSTPKVIGRGTINMLIDGRYNLQTTVSFRNYEGII